MKTSALLSGTSSLLAALFLACGGTPNAAPASSQVDAGAPDAAGSEIAPEATPDPALAKTAARYAECVQYYNTRAWDQLRTCYSDSVVQEEPDTGSAPWKGVSASIGHLQLFATSFPDSTIEPQITFVNGSHVVGLSLLRGTNTGPLPGGPTTKKPVGYLIAHTLELDESGLTTSEWIVYDHDTLNGQLGLGTSPRPVMAENTANHPVELAVGDDVEATNLAAYQKTITAFNAHNKAGFAAGLADNLVWSELSLPHDLSTADVLSRTTDLWSGFSNLKRTADRTWAAGAYVIGTGTLTGTNDGAAPALGLDKTGRKLAVTYVEIAHFSDGKWDQSWLFYNGNAVSTELQVSLK